MREIKFRVRRNDIENPTIYILEGFEDIAKWRDMADVLENCGQYFGLKDKNGKDVFVGDFLRTKYGTGQVCWDEQYFQFFILFDSENADGSEALDVSWSKDIEVIGNIYEVLEV